MKKIIGCLLIVMAVVAAACSSETETGGVVNAVSDSSELSGSIDVVGSSTVYPIVLKQAEDFSNANPGVAISVTGQGSGDGAALFCAGEVPITNASRLLKDVEVEICAANGVEFIEIRRGIDGITVITNPNNPLECVSFNELYALVSEDAIGFDNWSDANALLATIGADGELPDAPLDIFGPGEESGTFDSFAEIVVESVAKGKTGLDVESYEFSKHIRPDYTSSANDNIIIEGIASSDTSLGWVGFAYAKEAEEAGDVKLLSVSKEDGGECVAPSAETIASAEFPIARYLYTYVSVEAAENDPAVAAFVDYMLSDEGLEAVTAAGYVQLSDADQALASTLWEQRNTTRAWG